MVSFKFPLPKQQFIHGEYVDALSSDVLTLKSAVDDTVVCDDLQSAGAADVEAAVVSAEAGFKEWKTMSPAKKRACLLRLAELIERDAERLSYLETVLTGKAASFTHNFEITSAAESFRYFAGFVDKSDGDLQPTHDGFLRGVIQYPLGVCAAIIPFNSPIITFAMKAAPALAAGNSLITKASEVNPFSTLYLGELAIEAGVPQGVLNVIVGAGTAGAALASHMRIRKISFTGSLATGRKIQVAAAQSNLKRVTLELGGKSPVLVFDDADLENAVTNAMAFVSLNGQGCVLGTRIYVQEGIADSFVKGLKSAVEGFATTLGYDPFSLTTPSSPLFHHAQKETVMKFLDIGKKDATLVTGGDSWGDKGCYVQPTVFLNPRRDSEIVTKEIFGPVVVVDTFKSEEEVLQLANNTEYGLGATVYTKDLSRALRVTDALEAGSVGVNTAGLVNVSLPFGGWKESGIGAENAKYALRQFSQPKAITIKYALS